jgi:hypothetical protein
MSIIRIVATGVVLLGVASLQMTGEGSGAMERQAAASESVNGFIDLESGLQYRVLEAGTGERPSLGDTVVVEYRGTLEDGTEFDSTYRRGKPAIFPLRQVIPGWREALQLMPVGSRWQLIIPPQLAYGQRGSGGLIGPDATLAFDVELLAITTSTSNTIQLKDIEVSFRLDPRLTRGLYMGDRWVAPPTYSGTRSVGDTYTLDARVQGITASGGRVQVNPEWSPSDPEMVTVSAAGKDTVRIVVTQAGECRLKITANNFSKELLINSIQDGDAMQVQISQ